METKRDCPICLGSQAEVLHHQAFAVPADWPLPAEYDVVWCAVCGFVFADTPACQADYETLYRDLSKYEDASTSSGGGDSPADWARLTATADTVARFVPDLSAPVLDIGCGNGGLLAALAERGYSSLFGMDPSPVCVSRVSSLGISAVAGSLQSLDSEVAREYEGRFAMVTLTHVLEHLCDLRGAVAQALAFVASDGLLYVEVPDAGRYSSHFVVPYYYFDSEHINHFDEQALRNLAVSFGLEVVDAAAKEFLVADGIAYPVVWAVLRRTETGDSTMVRGAKARESVERYVTLSQDADSWPELERLAQLGEPVIVWGAGSYAQRMMKGSPLRECNIVGFVDMDSKKQGSLLDGIPISSPEVLNGLAGTIVVCAAVQGCEIEDEVRRRGLSNSVVLLNQEK